MLHLNYNEFICLKNVRELDNIGLTDKSFENLWFASDDINFTRVQNSFVDDFQRKSVSIFHIYFILSVLRKILIKWGRVIHLLFPHLVYFFLYFVLHQHDYSIWSLSQQAFKTK